jgi:cytochrome c oxidase subunit I+III
MHITGLLGMPRRVWTYPAGLGWEGLNLVSTGGAYLLAVGVGLFVFDLLRSFRPGLRSGDSAGNVWNAGTLEWLPNSTYGVRSIPAVTSREPLWERPELADEVRAGAHYLPDVPTGGRETIVTSAQDARPQYVLRLPGPGWPPVLAGWFTAFFFLALTLKLTAPAIVSGLAALALLWAWMWRSDPGSAGPVAIGGGISLPVSASGPSSHSGWAVLVLIVVAGAIFAALVFSYFFLWLASPEVWPAASGQRLPDGSIPLASSLLLIASSGSLWLGGRALASSRNLRLRLLLLLSMALLAAALACELHAQLGTGLRPTLHAYGALVYTVLSLQGVYVFTLAVMAAFVLARSFAGKLGPERRASWDNTALLWHYAVVQGLLSVALLHLAPRALA